MTQPLEPSKLNGADQKSPRDFDPITPASIELEPAANFHYPARVVLYALVIVTAAAMGWLIVVHTEGDLPARVSASGYLPEPAPQPTAAEKTIAESMEALRYYRPARPGEASAIDEPAPKAAADDANTPRAPRRLHPSAYKLSAIVNGPTGRTAIINGRFVEVGSTVRDATVVGIDADSVTLSLDGQMHTLRP